MSISRFVVLTLVIIMFQNAFSHRRRGVIVMPVSSRLGPVNLSLRLTGNAINYSICF